VVIMFELTGALTYLLPVMITLLVTKAVSDQIGGGGMADEVIRFNGYPFLEKEDKEEDDHAFIEPIANVMKKDIVMMTASGMPLQEISEIVQSTNYQGFPVVRGEEDRTIVGFVRKAELRYALDKAMRTRVLSPNATCRFQAISPDANKANGLLEQPDIVIPGHEGAAPRSSNVNAEPLRSSVSVANEVDFGQYVDETPLTVSPKMPLEIVMQLFRRMGPRVILVSQEGQLVGLVTVKDVLRHEAAHAHRSAASPPTQANHSREGSTSNWNGWTETWSTDGSSRRPTGLEVALEETMTWLRHSGESALSYIRGLRRRSRGEVAVDEAMSWVRARADSVAGGFRSGGGGPTPPPRSGGSRRQGEEGNPAYDFELTEEAAG